MNEVFETDTREPSSKYAFAIRYGFLLGFIGMFLKTISYLYLLKWSFTAFGFGRFLMIVAPIVTYIFIALATRKSLKNDVTVRDIFQKIFIVILISLTISNVYGLVYVGYIDPECLTREKALVLDFFERNNAPEEIIKDQMTKIQDAIDNAPSFSAFLYSHTQEIIKHSIFGFIIAFIASRKKAITQ